MDTLSLNKTLIHTAKKNIIYVILHVNKKKSYNTHIVRNETPLNLNIYMTHAHCQNRNNVRQKVCCFCKRPRYAFD